MNIGKKAALAALTAIALAGCGGGGTTTESRADAATDVVNIWEAVAIWYVDNSVNPTVTYEDGHYVVAGTPIEALLTHPDLSFTADGPDSWCVSITYNGGAAAVSDGSAWELKDSAGC